MAYYPVRRSLIALLLLSSTCLLSSLPARAQVGQSDWIKPGGSSQPAVQAVDAFSGQSGWGNSGTNDINPGQGWIPPAPQQSAMQQPVYQQQAQQVQQQTQPVQQQSYQPPQQLGSSGWMKPGQATPPPLKNSPFQVPQTAANQSPEPDFSQYDQQYGSGAQQTPTYDGGVSQNQYMPQAGNGMNQMSGQTTGMPPTQGMGGMSDPSMQGMSGLTGALGGMGSGAAGYDGLGKAINAAAQMGLIPGGTGGGNSPGLSMPKFGSQMGGGTRQVVTTSPGGQRSVLNNIPGVGLSKTVARSVNGAVNRNINYAVNRAMYRGLYRGFRY